jgi:L-amino acid N-acyltransferase YncA
MIQPAPASGSIRLATLDDGDAIARVHVAAWQQTYAGILPATFLAQLSAAEDARRWRRLIGDRTRGVFIYVVEAGDGGMVGFAAGGPNHRPDHRHAGELQALYLVAPWQRRGFCSALVRTVASHLAAAGMPSMIVWVLSKNRKARAFYRALGGQPAGRRQLEVAGVTLDAVAYGWRETKAWPMQPPARTCG